MAFKIALSATYTVTVKGELPNDQGKVDKFNFVAEFKRCDLDQLDELRKISQREVLRDVLVGWSGLLDEDNQTVPYNSAAKDAVLAIPQAVFALIEAFWASVYKAKEKN
jgi:hypothetical protein